MKFSLSLMVSNGGSENLVVLALSFVSWMEAVCHSQLRRVYPKYSALFMLCSLQPVPPSLHAGFGPTTSRK